MQMRGFTLVEVVVAMGLLVTAAVGGVYLLAFGTRAMHMARLQGAGALAASARLDELRSLRFEFDQNGQRVTDVSTRIDSDQPRPGGSGLTPGGAAALDTNVSGFVDYLDSSGAWVGSGPAPPPDAVFVRRWAIDSPAPDLLVLQVLVRPVAGDLPDVRRAAGEVRFVTVRARVRR